MSYPEHNFDIAEHEHDDSVTVHPLYWFAALAIPFWIAVAIWVW